VGQLERGQAFKKKRKRGYSQDDRRERRANVQQTSKKHLQTPLRKEARRWDEKFEKGEGKMHAKVEGDKGIMYRERERGGD